MGESAPDAIERYMVTFEGEKAVFVERPRLFQKTTIHLAVGETLTCDLPKRARVIYDRPDLPMINRSVQTFTADVSDGVFCFSAEKPNVYTVSFRNAFPFRNETYKVSVQ